MTPTPSTTLCSCVSNGSGGLLTGTGPSVDQTFIVFPVGVLTSSPARNLSDFLKLLLSVSAAPEAEPDAAQPSAKQETGEKITAQEANTNAEVLIGKYIPALLKFIYRSNFFQ
jgi:hypothetical protein